MTTWILPIKYLLFTDNISCIIAWRSLAKLRVRTRGSAFSRAHWRGFVRGRDREGLVTVREGHFLPLCARVWGGSLSRHHPRTRLLNGCILNVYCCIDTLTTQTLLYCPQVVHQANVSYRRPRNYTAPEHCYFALILNVYFLADI